MPKQINVKLGFQADTAQAKKQIQDLQNSLNNLMNSSIKNSATNGFDQQISNAQQSVLKLKTALNNSLNTDTGRLDLSKFNQQLNNSDLSLSKLAKDMTAMGADGQKAFLNLANSIVTAQKPMVESNKLLDSMWTALKNTARWQLSSSILHGFMGALQGAYGYAQDLDKSLNSIRIVTGQSADQMAVLAENANKSAQALSTSTLAYTDAALIYYQQGLGDEEVQKRVETTLKMSNVTGESAEQVSSYMTAIWNNFAEGSDNLELFADKITKLGAITASSSEEIANGLNQFAALGSSLGLSYDDATAALATVVAQTRQSASTVGNSFRTLFQRIESLKLGETLEDGVDLTKYSEALSKVGVQILDTNGDLRDMHDVIMDLGSAWEGLSKAQRNALAQTVGGVRNSNTLIAWMDNFDKFQDNLGAVADAEGTLQEQADIYAESWEAARKRVQTAWQSLYQDLIDEDFFIGVLNNIEKVLNGVDKLIDSIGGLPGVLSTVAAIFASKFTPQLTASLQDAQLQLSKILKPFGSDKTYAQLQGEKMQIEALQAAFNTRKATLSTPKDDVILTNLREQIKLNRYLFELRGKVGEQEFEICNQMIKTTEEYAKQTDITIQNMLAANSTSRKSTHRITDKWADAKKAGNVNDTINDSLKNFLTDDFSSLAKIQDQEVVAQQIEKIVTKYDAEREAIKATREEFRAYIQDKIAATKATTAKVIAENTEKENQEIVEQHLEYQKRLIKDASDAEKYLTQAVADHVSKIQDERNALEQNKQALENNKQALEQRKQASENNRQALEAELETYKQQQFQINKLAAQQKNYQKIQGQIVDTRKQKRNAEARLETVINKTPADAKESTELIAKRDALEAEITEYNKKLDELTAKRDKIIENVKKRIVHNIDKTTKDLDNVNNEVTELNEELDEATRDIEQATQDLDIATEKLNGAEEKYREGISGKSQSLNKSSDSNQPFFLRESFADGISTAFAGITQLTMGITTLSNAIEILNNQDLEPLDRIKQALPAILMGLPALLAGVAALTKGLFVLATGATLASVKGMSFLDFIIKMPIPVWIVIGALTALVFAINAVNNEWNKEAKAAEEAAKKAEEAKQAYDEVNSAFKSLKSTLENHLEARNALSDLKEGSDEWLKSVQDLNAETLDLISKYPDLAVGLKNVNGLLEIQQEQMEKIINLQYFDSISKYIDSLNADKNSRDANYISDLTDAARGMTYETGEKSSYMPTGYGETAPSINTISEEILQKAIDVWKENSDAFLNSESLKEALGIDNSEIVNALLAHQEEIRKLSEVLYNNNQIEQSSLDALVSTGVNNEIGEDISDVLWSQDKEYLNEEIQQYLIEQVNEELKNLDEITVEAYQQALQNARDDFNKNYNDIIQGFEQDSEKIAELKAEAKKTLDDTPVEFNTDGLTKKQAKEVQEEFANLTKYIYENAKAIDELDDHLSECRRESSRVAAAIIRFDDAIQDVTENYDDWNKALNSGSMQRATKAANEMRKSYANLLDIDGTVLSSQFLQNADNLDLMKQAIEGNEKAYTDLQEKANKDIVAHLTLIDDDFYDRAEALRNFVNSEDFGKLQIGAELNDEGFLTELTNLVNAAHMTQEQATAYLANMGIDAEIEQHKAEATDQKVVAGFTPHITEHREDGFTTTVDKEGNTKAQPFRTVVHGVSYERNETTLTEPKEETGFTLKVKSAHKSSGGAFKFKQATHGGGGVSPSGSGGKKGGGGGGSAKKKEVKEHVKDEDRYHDIKERIDDLNKSTDRLNKTKDRVYGKSKLKYINDEIEALEKQVKLTDEYIAEIKKYLALDLDNLKGIGMGAVFDENGMLTNYEQVLANITATYNKAIDEYNASAQEEADKEILEKAQKTYEENKKILKQYEDTYNLLQEQIDNRIDQINAIYDAKLAKIDWQVKLQLDFDDKDRELLEWIFDNMGDGADRAADRIANLNEQMETFDQDWETYRKGIKEIFSNHGINLDFDNLNSDQLVLQLQEFMRNEQLASELTEKEAEQLRDYLSGLMTTYTSMKETADEVHEILSDAIDAMAEEFEKQSEKIEQAGNIMKHYASIVDLTGRKLLKLSSSELRKMSQQIVKNAQDALGAAKAQMEDWRNQMQEAQTLMLKYQLEGDEQSYEYWKEHFEQLEELYTDATENYYSAWEEALEAANDAFEKSIDLMKENYENAFGDMDLTWMAEQFETQQELNELYLPDYKKYHELNASVRKLNKSLQDTNNTLIKGKMNDLLDEINAKMAAGVEISEYEAGIIERRIALLQAEAQLRDAQQAKSAVRMTRDNEGNFSYTYTADQDAIGDAEENYAEAVYDYQDYMVSMSNDLQSKWLEWNQYFAEREAEILAKYKEGTEEYNQAMAALAEERAAKLGWLTDQMGILFDEQKRFRDDDWADIENIVQMKLLSDEDLITSFDRTVLSAITGYDTLTELMDAGELAWENMLAAGEEALQTWQDNCYAIYEEAGTTVDNFAAKTEEDMASVAEDSQNAKNAIYDMVNNEENGMKKALEDAKQAARDFDDKYGKYMTSIQNATQTTVGALNALLKKLNETYQAQSSLADQAAKTSSAIVNAMNNAIDAMNDAAAAQEKLGNQTGSPNSPSKDKDTNTTSTKSRSGYIAPGGSNLPRQAFYASGGYTGDWPTDSGRLAVLHKKELVLNEDDTSNMLKIVGFVRRMTSQATAGLQSMFKNNINYNGVNSIGSGEFNQNVHIEASFPNVQSHTEIELALNNLINSATQYVNRK